MTIRDHPIVILGAGLCGLSSAYHLERCHGADYLLLERELEVGGLARTAAAGGFAFDHAIHILYSRDPYATDLICNTLLAGKLSGKFQTGDHFAYKEDTPMSNLLVTILDSVGVPIEKLGDSTGRLLLNYQKVA